MKLFKTKKSRLIALLTANMAVLSAALIISTVSWFSSSVPITPDDDIPSSILSSYFDMNDGVDETQYAHGTVNNPYVISRPVHYYNLVRLHELGTYGFSNETYFQFGKQFETDGPYLFYNYSDSGILQSGYTPYLNMKYYSDTKALAPIGSARHPFEGHIIGNNTTVQNLYIKGGGFSDVGIFGYVSSNAVINNLYFDTTYIDAADASAIASSSLGHATHNSHVYIGFLAGHVYSPAVFNNVYLQNCHLYNTTVNGYEMINTYGYFGHTDEPLESTSDSSSYTSDLSADKAFEALGQTYANGANEPLARRYTDQVSSGKFNSAVKHTSSSYYNIYQQDSSHPYSLSSIGYSSGDDGTEAYIRYIKTEGGVNTLKTIDNVADDNILTDKPYDDTYGYFGGMNDGAYIYWDSTNSKWMYAEVTCDTTVSTTGTVILNCFTISYTQTVSGTTKTYYLKYEAQNSGYYSGKLVADEWTDSSAPTANEYYFCFKASYDDPGVSQITESAGSHDYYIYSPVGKNYVCTYSPQNVYGSYCNSANLVHTPVFVSESGTNGHYPTLFTIGGPTTFITYDAVTNSNTGSNYTGDVNDDFDNNSSTTIARGALQGPNLTASGTFGVFGGHKMTAGCRGGEFTIGAYNDNQTTTLTNAVNFKLTGNSSDIEDGATLLLAGFDSEQTSSVSTDYAMATQADNNRLDKTVYEVRDGNDYVINDTTGVAKLTFHYTDTTNGYFTLFDGGYLYNPTDNSKNNYLRTKESTYDIANDTSGYCQWTFVPITCSGQITKYVFQNVGNTSKYLCYNNSNHIFSCYSSTQVDYYYNSQYLSATVEDYAALSTSAKGSIVSKDGDDNIISNTKKWFYIYKQQTGQSISNVHYTTSTSIEVEGATVYPYKTYVEYDLLSASISSTPTDINAYSNFTVDPSYNVYFDTVQSQVHYYDTVVETWKRVSIVSELQDGDEVVIGTYTTGTTHYFMSTTQNTNYRGRTSNVSFTDPYLGGGKLPNNAQKFTLQKSGSYWRFYTGSGYLYAASSSANYLRTETSPDSNGNANFSISFNLNAEATVVAQGTNTRNKIQYYSSGRNSYFSCFSSSQTSICIYKLTTSSADEATYVGDLIDNFEPTRMDVIGPSVNYYSTYFTNAGASSYISTPATGDTLYVTNYFKNCITLMVDATGSKDLGTLIIEYEATTNQPYFMPTSNSNDYITMSGAGAVDTDTVDNDNVHRYLLNINATNIGDLRTCCVSGSGTSSSPYVVCSESDENLSKYLIVIGFASDVQISEVNFTFNAVPGNIGYAGTVDYRSATYDNDGNFTGSVSGGQQVTSSALSIYYDVTNTGQKVSVNVTYEYNETYRAYAYVVTVDSSGTVLTEDLVMNLFKYDNNASILLVYINGSLYGNAPIYTGTTSITISASS